MGAHTQSETHTPGPWEPVSDSHYVAPVGVVTPLVALVFHSEQRAANARLIAAAPDLLEALQERLAQQDKFARLDPEDEWTAKARAAIRKALPDGSEARAGGEEG